MLHPELPSCLSYWPLAAMSVATAQITRILSNIVLKIVLWENYNGQYSEVLDILFNNIQQNLY